MNDTLRCDWPHGAQVCACTKSFLGIKKGFIPISLLVFPCVPVAVSACNSKNRTMTAHKTFNWDYEVLGSIGYHQVGQPDAFEKRTIENSVLRDLMRLPQFQIPEELTGYVQLSIKRFSHDAGDYDQLCLLYDWIQLEHWELSDCPQENSIAAQFYTWLDTMQCYDYESTKLLQLCQQIYEQRNGVPPQVLTFNQAAL